MTSFNIAELKKYLQNLPKPIKRRSDKERAKILKSFFKFVQVYFPHHINHAKKESSEFRRYIYTNINQLSQQHKHLLFMAYRGAAKTTLLVQLYILYKVAKGEANYPIIISDAMGIAKNSLEFIKTELEDNQDFINDFAISQGDSWQAESITFSIEKSKVKVQCFGSGKRIRGANYLGSRPDLIIVDDLENDENVQSKAQRDKLEGWFKKAILKLPARTGHYNIIVVGTNLHHDSVLARLMNGDKFKSFNFPLVKQFPINIEEQSVKNGKIPKDFIIDDEQLNRQEILLEYLEDKNSFMSEYQNQPMSKDLCFLSNYETYSYLPSDCVFYIGIDPALGKAKGDYSAIAVLAYSKSNNKFYATAQGYKIDPSALIHKIIKLAIEQRDKLIKLAIETVAFQEFFKSKLKEEASKYGINLPVVEIKNKIAKEIRLDGLSPFINDQSLVIDQHAHLLKEELDTYPKAAHDDLLDALEMALRVAKKSGTDFSKIDRLMKARQARFSSIAQKI